MDAAEADTDIKLYKASAELLLELRAKVPRLVRTNENTFRRWISDSKCLEVTRLLNTFQEWPQLLDPYLASLIQDLVDAYLSYCVSHPHEYTRTHQLHGQVWPLPTVVARVLYAFCKVRGQKIIVRLLNNEPKYIEPLLSCFDIWTRDHAGSDLQQAMVMTWEERYVHLLWLSHLMLAPFELSTISILTIGAEGQLCPPELCTDLPNVAVNLLTIGLNHLNVPSKAREAASTLLVRLSLRTDMQKIGLANRLVQWAARELQTPQDQEQSTGYRYIGLLALLFGIVSTAPTSESNAYLGNVFSLAYESATSSLSCFQSIRESAPARKLLIKVMRSAVVHGITLHDAHKTSNLKFDIDSMLENCVQALLDLLGDKDTPVRQAASKALSQVCQKLQEDMSVEVVEAVIDSLNENLLLEDIANGKLFPITDVAKGVSLNYKKNVNAVDPHKWHGCMLTLGHLLFRRSLPVSQLPAVVEVLLMGLEFEQRSNVGTSVGVSVRDAACFGIWSLARKYSTSELNAATVGAGVFRKTFVSPSSSPYCSTLQLIATHLAMAACLDPTGNLRRGSSAALQELIGRHPDAIAEGIPVVQTIDYHAVARRSRAITEVAIGASKLSRYYHGAILFALLSWRGARATDANSRRQAAQAVGLLMSTTTEGDVLAFLGELIALLGNLKISNTGSNAATRHGLLCCLASTLQSLDGCSDLALKQKLMVIVMPVLQDLALFAGAIDGRVTSDVEIVLEGLSKVILVSAHFVSSLVDVNDSYLKSEWLAQWIDTLIPILERCTVASDKDSITMTAAQANLAIWDLMDADSQQDLAEQWLDQKRQSRSDYTCKGRIATLGQMLISLRPGLVSEQKKQMIVQYITSIVNSSYPIETKVNAMQGITAILGSQPIVGQHDFDMLAKAVRSGLTDYTIDQRGDVGSLLRMESIEAARQLSTNHLNHSHAQGTKELLVRLAAERLVKVRFEAWKCLEIYLKMDGWTTMSFNHVADISSFEYFRNLMELVKAPQYRQPLLLGLLTSIAGGTEEVSRACGEAFVAFVHDQGLTAQETITNIIEVIAQYTINDSSIEDREIIPAIDFLAFVVEHWLSNRTFSGNVVSSERIWTTCQHAQTNSSSIMRLEALVRLYGALTLVETCRTLALDKLSRLLLHRWPKIRGTAADAIFMYTGVQSLTLYDWNAPVLKNKSAVLALRKELNVAGSSAVTNPAQMATAA